MKNGIIAAAVRAALDHFLREKLGYDTKALKELADLLDMLVEEGPVGVDEFELEYIKLEDVVKAGLVYYDGKVAGATYLGEKLRGVIREFVDLLP